MGEKPKTFYVTSPIFYPNARPHMGHAYTTLLCDVLARYHRLIGEETYFLTGTDEHTEKVIQAAEAHGKKPEAYLEEVVSQFKSLYTSLGISFDQFIRTSDRDIHWPGAIEMWNCLVEAGDIYKSDYVGLYCIGHEAFLTEKELDSEGKCPDHGTKPELVKEENYFFRLKKYTSELEEIITNDVVRIVPSVRKNEILSLLKSGLEDVSFSRPKEKMTWGIPVPNDPMQTMYIWVDALTNYITALGFGRGEKLMHFWPGVHVIGKDILRFHAAFWPAMLMSAKLPLPRAILVHGLITSGGRKMSKTLGNIIDPQDLIDKYGAEAVRYYLCRHISPFEDGDMTNSSFADAYEANLVNGLGNLVARIMKMAEENLHCPVECSSDFSITTESIRNYNIQQAVNGIWEHIGFVDDLIQKEQPFNLVRENKGNGMKLIAKYVKELHLIATELGPVMPKTSARILEAIKINKKPENLFPRLAK